MTTRQVVETYFQKIKEKSDWQTFIADNIRFDSPSPTTFGKDQYVVAASRFFQMAESLELQQLVIEDEIACAWVDYKLRKGNAQFNCIVSELLHVQNDRIISSAILFDTHALKNFTTSN